MVHNRPRYMLGCTPRVKGYSPGAPRSLSYLTLASSGLAAAGRLIPLLVSKLPLRSSGGTARCFLGPTLSFFAGFFLIFEAIFASITARLEPSLFTLSTCLLVYLFPCLLFPCPGPFLPDRVELTLGEGVDGKRERH